MLIQRYFLPTLSPFDSARPTFTARRKGIPRWLVIAGLLAVGACSSPFGPAHDCTTLENGPGSLGDGVPAGMACAPEQATTSPNAPGNSTSAVGN